MSAALLSLLLAQAPAGNEADYYAVDYLTPPKGARLEVGGVAHELGAGDWILIPAGEPHVLHDAAPGTSWLAVHAPHRPRD